MLKIALPPSLPDDAAWDSLFGRLEQFYREHGHVRVPRNRRTDLRLTDWLSRQQTNHAQLSLEQVQKLMRVGFHFSGRHSDWYQRFFDLRDFVREHGHFPRSTKDLREESLAKWVSLQRKRKQKGRAEIHQIRLLQTLDICWEPQNDRWYETWENHYRELVLYVGRYGHFPKRSNASRALLNWTRHQRKRKNLTSDQRDKLGALGFSWDPRDEQWDSKYAELKEFRARFGHCQVPADEPHYRPLYRWLHYQKQQRKQMSVHRRRRLNSLGLDWTIASPPSLEERMQQLERFQRKHGHCNVTVPDDRALAVWLAALRRRKERLSPEVVERLEAMRIDWNPTESLFAKRLQELSMFRSTAGHCRVPINCPNFPGLGQWVQTQRTLENRKQLSPERKRQLSEAGFEWRNWDLVCWEENYRKLEKFSSEYGHTQVPGKYDQALSDWVHRQRFYKANLNGEQIRRLSEIGFPWNSKKPVSLEIEPDEIAWGRRLKQLKHFHSEKGHCLVPVTHPDYGFARWVTMQREHWNLLSLDSLLALIRLGFVFKPKDRVWTRRFGELAAFMRSGKNKNVAELCQADKSLSQWVIYQRSIRRRLSGGQIRLLEEAGVKWTPKASAWREQYDKLAEFHRRHGHCVVPKIQRALAHWTYSQRRRKERLSREQKRLLEAIGFEWDPAGKELDQRLVN